MFPRLFASALALGALTMTLSSPADAATLTVTSEEGTRHVSEHGIRTFVYNGEETFNTSTFGTDLVGMSVTATFADKTTETLTWGDLSSMEDRHLGGVSGANYSLSFSTEAFTLSTTSLLTSLSIDAGSGNALFDILRYVKDGTRGDTWGTKIGFPYETVGGDDLFGDIVASYSDAISFRGIAEGTDAFKTLTINYAGLLGGGLLGTTQFTTDLDSLKVAGDLTPVPLPATLPMMAFGAGALVLMRRRQR